MIGGARAETWTQDRHITKEKCYPLGHYGHDVRWMSLCRAIR
jgi:hypothetical protein